VTGAVLYSWTPLGDFRPQTLNLPTPGKNPAVAHDESVVLGVFVVCAEGFYGHGCTERCSCANNATCDSHTGACRCTAGWTGETCDQRTNVIYRL